MNSEEKTSAVIHRGEVKLSETSLSQEELERAFLESATRQGMESTILSSAPPDFSQEELDAIDAVVSDSMNFQQLFEMTDRVRRSRST